MAYDRLAQALIKAESGGRRYAQNPRSTAGGPSQFLDDTWLDVVRRHRPDIAAGKSDAQVLSLRNDPALSAEMTQRYAQDNAGYLQSRGIEPSREALSLAHFAGPGGAAKVYSDPNETVRSLLGEDAMAANPFLKGKTGRDLIDWAGKRVSPGKSTAARLRQRYSGGRTGTENAPRADSTASAEAAADPKAKLSTALGGSDPKAADRWGGLAKAGQRIAGSDPDSPLAAIGGTILSGIGGYKRDKAEGEQRQARQQALEAVRNAKNPEELAAALMASPDEKMRSTGIRMRAESMGPKAPPEIQSITVGKDQFGRPITRKVYFDRQEGRLKPAENLLSGESPAEPHTAPQTASQPPQTGVPPQGPSTPRQTQTPPQQGDSASDGPVIRDLPDEGAQDGTPAQPEPQTSSLPEGVESHPVPAPNLPDGVVQKLGPDGTGYQYRRREDGGLDPVLESEEAAKLTAKAKAEKQANKSKLWGQVQSMEQSHGVVQEDIDRALDNYLETGQFPETGMFAYLSYVPGTSAYDLSQLLTTIRSNVGFDKLQEMRENSPTGGALGQVSNLELNALQSVLGSMDQFQTGDQLKQNLQRLSEILEKSRKRRREAYRQDFGGLPEPATSDSQSKEKPEGGKPQFSPGAEVGDADLANVPEGSIVRDPRSGQRFIIRGGKPVPYGE